MEVSRGSVLCHSNISADQIFSGSYAKSDMAKYFYIFFSCHASTHVIVLLQHAAYSHSQHVNVTLASSLGSTDNTEHTLFIVPV